MAVNVATYIYNLGKSVGYSAVDQLKEQVPATADFIDTNQELFKEVYTTIKDYKTTFKKIDEKIKGSKIYEAATAGWNNALEDIKTGKFYNKERADEASWMGDEQDDAFDIDGLDINFDDDDDMDFDKGDILISKTVSKSNKKVANAISNTIAESTNANIEIQKKNTSLLYTQGIEQVNALKTGFGTINENIKALMEFNNKNILTHIKNSDAYYNTMTKAMQDQNTILQTILNSMGPAEVKEKSNDKVTIDDILSGDSMDLTAYFKGVKKNIENSPAGQFLGMNNMFGDNSNVLLSLVESPFKFITDGIAKTLTSKTLGDTLKEFDSTVKGFFGSIISKFNALADDGESGFINQWIGKIFGFKVGSKTSIDTSKYEKGKVPWDGIAKKALTEVIPAQLAKIISLMSGEGERIFDYDSGKWVEARSISESRKNNLKSYGRNAASDITSQLNEFLNYVTFDNDDQRKSFMDDMENFFQNRFEKGGWFDLNKKDLKSDYFDYGVSNDKNFGLLIEMLKNLPKDMLLNYNREVLDKGSSRNKYYNDLEDKGYSLEAYNNNNFFIDQYVKRDKKGNITKKYGIMNALDLNEIKDKLGNNIFFYLQNIHSDIKFLRMINERGGFGSGNPLQTFNSILGSSRTIEFSDGSSSQINRDGLRYSDAAVENNIKGYTEAEERAREREYNDNQNKRRNKGIDEEIKKSGKFKVSYDELDEEKGFRFVSTAIQHNKLIDKMKEDKESGKNNRTMIDKLLEAKSIPDKLKTVIKSFDNVLKTPADTMTKIFRRADDYMFNMIYGPDVEDENGGRKSVVGLMVDKIKDTFQKVNDFIDTKILEPIRKKFEVKNMKELFFKLIGVEPDTIEDLKNSFLDYLFGTRDENGKRNKDGLLSSVTEGIKESLKEKASGFKEFVSNLFAPINDVFKNFFKTKDKLKENEDGEIDSEEALEAINNGASREAVLQYVRDGKVHYRDAKSLKELKRLELEERIKSADSMSNNTAELLREAYNQKYDISNYKSTKESAMEAFDGVEGYGEEPVSEKSKIDKAYKLLSDIQNQLQKDYDKLRDELYDYDTVTKEYRRNNVPMAAIYNASKPMSLYNQNINTLVEYLGGESKRKLADFLLKDAINIFDTKALNELGDSAQARTTKNLITSGRQLADPKYLRSNIKKSSVVRAIKDYEDENPEPVNYNNLESILGLSEEELGTTAIDVLKAMGLASKASEQARLMAMGEGSGANVNEFFKEFAKDSLLGLKIGDIKKALTDKNKTGLLNKLFGNAVDLTSYGDESTLRNILKSYEGPSVKDPNYVPDIEYQRMLAESFENNFAEQEANFQNPMLKFVEGISDKFDTLISSINRLVSHITGGYAEGGTIGEEDDSKKLGNVKKKKSKVGEYKPEFEALEKYLNTTDTDFIDDIWNDTPSFAKGGIIGEKVEDRYKDQNGKKPKDKGIVGRTPQGDIITVQQGETILTEEQQKDLSKAQKIVNSTKDKINSAKDTAKRVLNIDQGKSIVYGEDGPVKEAVDIFKENVLEISNILFGDPKIDKKTLMEKLAQVGKDTKTFAPEMITSGLIGGGVSLLTGMIGGPLLGAAVGAGVGLATKSKTVQDFLFGETDENGKFKEGLFNKETTAFIKKYAPDMAKGGMLGLLASPLLPGGPFTGMLMGSALGFAKKNEKVQEFLFGEENGILNKKRRAWLKEKVPRALSGALPMILAGPFGLTGNLILGAGLGILNSTDKFHKLIFGEKDEKTGKNFGGLLPTIRDTILTPFTSWMKDTGLEIMNFFKETIGENIKDAFYPIKSLASKTKDWVAGLFSKGMDKLLKATVGIPLSRLIDNASELGKNILGQTSKLVKNTLGFTIGLPFKLGGYMGRKIKLHDIKKGTSVGTTAEERINMMSDNGINDYATKDLDEWIVQQNFSDNKEEFDKVRDIAKMISGGSKEALKEHNTIRKKLSYGFSKNYREDGGFLSSLDINKVNKAIKKGEYEKAINVIQRSKTLRDDRKEEMIGEIQSQSAKLDELSFAANNFEDFSKSRIGDLNSLNPAFSNINSIKDVKQLFNYLNTEKKVDSKPEIKEDENGEPQDPVSKILKENQIKDEEHHTETIEALNRIYVGLKMFQNGGYDNLSDKEKEIVDNFSITDDIKENNKNSSDAKNSILNIKSVLDEVNDEESYEEKLSILNNYYGNLKGSLASIKNPDEKETVNKNIKTVVDRIHSIERTIENLKNQEDEESETVEDNESSKNPNIFERIKNKVKSYFSYIDDEENDEDESSVTSNMDSESIISRLNASLEALNMINNGSNQNENNTRNIDNDAILRINRFNAAFDNLNNIAQQNNSSKHHTVTQRNNNDFIDDIWNDTPSFAKGGIIGEKVEDRYKDQNGKKPKDKGIVGRTPEGDIITVQQGETILTREQQVDALQNIRDKVSNKENEDPNTSLLQDLKNNFKLAFGISEDGNLRQQITENGEIISLTNGKKGLKFDKRNKGTRSFLKRLKEGNPINALVNGFSSFKDKLFGAKEDKEEGGFFKKLFNDIFSPKNLLIAGALLFAKPLAGLATTMAPIIGKFLSETVLPAIATAIKTILPVIIKEAPNIINSTINFASDVAASATGFDVPDNSTNITEEEAAKEEEDRKKTSRSLDSRLKWVGQRALKDVSTKTNGLGKLLNKIPILGKPLSKLYGLGVNGVHDLGAKVVGNSLVKKATQTTAKEAAETSAKEGTETGLKKIFNWFSEKATKVGTKEAAEASAKEGTETGLKKIFNWFSEKATKVGTKEAAETSAKEGTETGLKKIFNWFSEKATKVGTKEAAEASAKKVTETATKKGAEAGFTKIAGGKAAETTVKKAIQETATKKGAEAGFTKIAGGKAAETTVKKAIQETAKEGAETAAKAATDKVTKEVIEVGVKESSEEALKGIIRKAFNWFSEKAVSIFSDSTIISLIGEKLSNSLIKKFSVKISESIVGKIAKEIIKKAGKGIATKLGAAIAKKSPLVILFAVSDFVDGWNNCRQNFNILEPDDNLGMMLLSAIIKLIGGLLILPDFVGAETTINLGLFILKFFGLEFTGLEKARARASKIIDQFNKTNGTNYQTVEEYLNGTGQQGLYNKSKQYIEKEVIDDNLKTIGLGIDAGFKAGKYILNRDYINDPNKAKEARNAYIESAYKESYHFVEENPVLSTITNFFPDSKESVANAITSTKVGLADGAKSVSNFIFSGLDSMIDHNMYQRDKITSNAKTIEEPSEPTGGEANSTDESFKKLASKNKNKSYPKTKNTLSIGDNIFNARPKDTGGEDDDYVGKVVKQFESGSKGSLTIADVKGDVGGASFGTYQFASNTGSLKSFWDKYYASQYPNVSPGGNQAFKNAWTDAVNKDPEGFFKNEHTFLAQESYGPFVNSLKTINPNEHSRAAQEAGWSTAIQYGAGGAKQVWDEALSGVNKNISDKDLIDKLYQYKANDVGVGHFIKSSTEVQNGVRNRFLNREPQAISALYGQKPIDIAAVSGSTINGSSSNSSSSSDSSSSTENSKLQLSEGHSLVDLFSDLGSVFSNAFGSATNGASGNSSSSSSDSTSSDFTNVATGDAKLAVDAMASKEKKLTYSMEGPRNPDKGSADCSSTVAWALRKAGADVPLHSSTLSFIESNKGTVVDRSSIDSNANGAGKVPDESKLKPGDVFLYRRSGSGNGYTSGRPYRVGHIEMYMGNGKRMGHGGGMGPKFSSISSDSDNYIMAKRFINDSSDTTTEPALGGDIFGNNINSDIVKSDSSTAATDWFKGTLQNFGKVSSDFGDTRGRKNSHHGIDFSTNDTVNNPVASPISGKVYQVGNDPKGFGNYVKIKDIEGNIHIFGHLNKPSTLSVGSMITIGDIIGYSGNTGNSTGPHLHYSVQKNDNVSSSVDPNAYLADYNKKHQMGGDPPAGKPRSNHISSSDAKGGTEKLQAFSSNVKDIVSRANSVLDRSNQITVSERTKSTSNDIILQTLVSLVSKIVENTTDIALIAKLVNAIANLKANNDSSTQDDINRLKAQQATTNSVVDSNIRTQRKSGSSLGLNTNSTQALIDILSALAAE